jgi:ferrochelatase
MKTGVLVCGYGGPDSLDAVGPFMKNLMGFEPTPELLERVKRRYLAIGGASPLTGIAIGIAEKLEEALGQQGHPMPVVVGMAYWQPFIADALAHLKDQGCERVIAVALSPFESKIAHGKYRASIDEAAERIGGIEIVEAPLVSELDQYAAYFAGATAVSLTDIKPNEGIIIVFSAHSLPESDLVEDDPYVAGLRQIANSVALRLGLSEGSDGSFPMIGGIETFGSAEAPRAWYLAYQSKGNRPGAWLGPDLDDVIASLVGTEAKGVVVTPIGFMTDHMETLYDLDIVAAGKALDAGLEFVRTEVPNDHPSLIEAIARSVAELA